MRLSLASLAQVRPGVARPAYDVATLGCGIVHLGLGAFHRAHQAAFTDAALADRGGQWGIIGVGMRRAGLADALAAQDGLYALEILDAPAPRYRVIGALRRTLALPREPQAVIAAIAAPTTHVVTLTVTEKGYDLAGEALDLAHPDIVHDLAYPARPRSAIGALVAGLERRQGGPPLTVISCDNLDRAGPRLAAAVLAFAERRSAALARWIGRAVAFPDAMVDSITPASTPQSRARADAALGLSDLASVQREPFAVWVIEDRFAGPVPAWAGAGVEIVADVAPSRRLKLHILNTVHSTLAWMGLPRGHRFVCQAIADPDLAAFADALVAEEIAPALAGLPVARYWAATRRRLANPAIDHRLAQIGEDSAEKLAERVAPLILANRRSGAPTARLQAVVRAWRGWAGPDARLPPSVAGVLETAP